ncbi:hypothetical protein AXG93_2186s1000 [Marchantia polymorpha subsp. ruderalis]|uniref:Uncharacterized protein n=1 Tax=Marchantia polymorpha subsp. ruderalis TaxID=1480154 RepID=A0A176WT65_MARPO|nr:hypothetical protein AXG93_2186s1000 [Marchantia polymorpha subsp. ruderalis]
MFGRKAIIDGDEFSLGKFRDLRTDRMMAFQRADDKAATMQISRNSRMPGSLGIGEFVSLVSMASIRFPPYEG